MPTFKLKPLLFPIFIPALFIIIATVLTINYIRQYQGGFLSLHQSYASNRFRMIDKRILKGDYVVAEFESKYQNLGSVYVRFRTSGKIVNDRLIFRIKVKDNPDWYYQNTYATDQFSPGQLFPFGFPIIKDSQGKFFVFELESLSGVDDNAVVVDAAYPAFVTTHHFDFSDFSLNPNRILWFISQKYLDLFGNPDFFAHFLIFYLPAFFYLSLLLLGRWYQLPFLMLVVVMGLDIWWFEKTPLILNLVIIFAWGFLVWRYRFESQISSSLTLIILALLIIMNLSEPKFSPVTNKLALWFYLWLIASVGHLFYEVILLNKPKVFLPAFWPSILTFLYQVGVFTIEIVANPRAFIPSITVKPQAFIPSSNFLQKIFMGSYFTILSLGLLWVGWMNINYLNSYFEFYLEFLPTNQLHWFLVQTGVYLILWYLALTIGVLYYSFKISRQRKLLTLLLTLVFALMGSNIIFTKTTTKLRDNIFIWSVTPQRATLWDEVTLTGRNFQDMPWRNQVLVDGVEHRILKWADQEIVFQAEPGKTTSGQVKVIRHDGKTSNSMEVEYYDFFTHEKVE